MKERISITKGARQFGYLIWNSKNGSGLEKILQGKESIKVRFNGFDLGEKHIDYKYHRISLGYKLTRAMPKEHTIYEVAAKGDLLEVKSNNGQ